MSSGVVDPMGGIGAAAATARVPVPADAADRARLAATQARARGNLAAIICDTWCVDPADPDWDDMALFSAAYEFAELAECLGLQPKRPAGYCACGAVLPLSSLSAACAATYGPGQCVACTRKARGTA